MNGTLSIAIGFGEIVRSVKDFMAMEADGSIVQIDLKDEAREALESFWCRVGWKAEDDQGFKDGFDFLRSNILIGFLAMMTRAP
jgi:hypothetical protein